MDASPGPGRRHERTTRRAAGGRRRLAGSHGLRLTPGAGSLLRGRCRGGHCRGGRSRGGRRSRGVHRSQDGCCKSGDRRSRSGHRRNGAHRSRGGGGSRLGGQTPPGCRGRSHAGGRDGSPCRRGGWCRIGNRCLSVRRHRGGSDGRCGSPSLGRRRVSRAGRWDGCRRRPGGGRYPGGPHPDGRYGGNRHPMTGAPTRRGGWNGRAWPCRGCRPAGRSGRRSGPRHRDGHECRNGCYGNRRSGGLAGRRPDGVHPSGEKCRRSVRPDPGALRGHLGRGPDLGRGRRGGRHHSSDGQAPCCPGLRSGVIRPRPACHDSRCRQWHHGKAVPRTSHQSGGCPPGPVGRPGSLVRRYQIARRYPIRGGRERHPRQAVHRSWASLHPGRSCRLRRGYRTFPVPQTHLPTFSLSGFQTSEEGRSTLCGERPSSVHVRRRPTLPRGPPRSTIGAEELNFRVRNGTGCFPFAVTAVTLWRCDLTDRTPGTA